MFSVDDSFDLDDEIFLTADVNNAAGGQVNYHHKPADYKQPPSAKSSHVSHKHDNRKSQDGLSSERTDAASASGSCKSQGQASGSPNNAAAPTSQSCVVPSTESKAGKGFVSRLVRSEDPPVKNNIVQHEQVTKPGLPHKKFHFKPLAKTKASILVTSSSVNSATACNVPQTLSNSHACSLQRNASSGIVHNGSVLMKAQSSVSSTSVSEDFLFDNEEDSWLGNLDLSTVNGSLHNREFTTSALMDNNQQNSVQVGRSGINVSGIKCSSQNKELIQNLQKLDQQSHLKTDCHALELQLNSYNGMKSVDNASCSELEKVKSRSSPAVLQESNVSSRLHHVNDVLAGTVVSNSEYISEQICAVDANRGNANSALGHKRKFPGPAGALRQSASKNRVSFVEPPKKQSHQAVPLTQNNEEPDVFSSQRCEDWFLSGPWQVMKQDLEPQAKRLLEEFNISNIVKKAMKKLLPKGKVPVLCVVIDHISLDGMEASVILRDPTGKIKGTIHRLVVKEYAADMQPGTVLVLHQVAVFSPPAARNHYLNITPNNIVRIYSKEDGKSAVSTKHITTFADEDFNLPQLSAGSSLNKSSAISTAHLVGKVNITHLGSVLSLSKSAKHNNDATQIMLKPHTMPVCDTPVVRINYGCNNISDFDKQQLPCITRHSDAVTSRPASSALLRQVSKTCSQTIVQSSSGGMCEQNSSARSSSSLRADTGITSDDANCVGSLWQDDQLDDILSVLGDEDLLAEC